MDRLALAPVTMCLMKATLAAGTTTTLSSTGTIYYAIKGKAYSHAALSNTATPTTDAVTAKAFVGVPVNYGSVFLVGFNAAGDLKCAQGTVEAIDATPDFLRSPQFPALPDDFCPVGALVVQVGSTGATWTFGASNTAAATGVTYTFVDLISLPDRPLVA